MCSWPREGYEFHNGRSTDTTSDGIPTRISAIRGTAALKLLTISIEITTPLTGYRSPTGGRLLRGRTA